MALEPHVIKFVPHLVEPSLVVTVHVRRRVLLHDRCHLFRGVLEHDVGAVQHEVTAAAHVGEGMAPTAVAGVAQHAEEGAGSRHQDVRA